MLRKLTLAPRSSVQSPMAGTGEDAFLRKVAEGSSARSLKPKGTLKEVDIEVSEGCPVMGYR